MRRHSRPVSGKTAEDLRRNVSCNDAQQRTSSSDCGFAHLLPAENRRRRGAPGSWVVGRKTACHWISGATGPFLMFEEQISHQLFGERHARVPGLSRWRGRRHSRRLRVSGAGGRPEVHRPNIERDRHYREEHYWHNYGEGLEWQRREHGDGGPQYGAPGRYVTPIDPDETYRLQDQARRFDRPDTQSYWGRYREGLGPR
jgi:hypothetical protein